MNRLESIQSFIHVVERGSFSATAQHLGIAKSVISKRIKELEDYLGLFFLYFELTFIREAKQLPAYKYTPVVMLTTEAGETKKQESQAMDAKAWIVKPFQPAQMLAAVSKLVA